MIKTKFVFAVSFVAMMAVGTGYAEIAGVSYVEQQVGVATTAANNAQTSANNANTAAGNAQTSADNAQDAADAAQESADAAAASAKTANDTVALKQDKLTTAQLNAANSGITSAKVSTYDGYAATIAGKQDKLGYTAENTANKATSFDDTTASDTKYPSTSAVKSYVSAATSTINTTIEAVQTAVGGKQATLTTSNVKSSGTGNVVTAVTASNGTVTVTKGTTLGGLATKSAVGSSEITDASIATADIADGAVTTAKIAASAVTSAKIADGAVATADIAAGAVTAAKTTGIYGFIPSGT